MNGRTCAMAAVFFGFSVLFLGAAEAGRDSEPMTFQGGMNKEYFADKYMNPQERQRIAETMCGADSFLMQ
jgi:hypothetical protein